MFASILINITFVYEIYFASISSLISLFCSGKQMGVSIIIPIKAVNISRTLAVLDGSRFSIPINKGESTINPMQAIGGGGENA